MTTLALFDFDGTITTCDSFTLFLRRHSPVRFACTVLRLLPQIALFAAGKYPNDKLKEAFLQGILRGVTESELKKETAQFVDSDLQAILRPQALERIVTLQREEARIVVVTASPRLLVEPWCRQAGIMEILGTELEVKNSTLTGRLAGHNCRAEEKVRRINDYLRLADYDRIEVYGDSSGDCAMLELATESGRFFKPFRK